MSQENLDRVRRAYEGFNEAAERRKASHLDMSWFAEFAAPEFEYVAGVGIPGLDGEVLRGLDDFQRFLDAFWGTFDEARTTVVDLIDAGDAVLAVVDFHGKGAQSGVTVEMTAFQLWTFRDDKLVRGEGFTNRAAAFEAAGLP